MAINLPVLAQSRWLRFGVFSSYYLLQGLPFGICFIGFPAWFTGQGVSTEMIASFSAITGLPWALKLIVGPLMDRYSFLPMGMRRPWIMGMQGLLMLVTCMLFFISDAINQFWWLVGLCTAMNVCAASEDVAVDGLAIAIIPEAERGRANAFMGAGQMLGISLTGLVSVKLLNFGGVPALAIFLLSVILVLFLISTFIRERAGERFLPWTKGEPSPDIPIAGGSLFAIMKDLLRTLFLPMSVLVILITFIHRLHSGFYRVWAPDISINLFGYTDADYATWSGITMVAGALIGLAFGPVVDKIGAVRAFKYCLVAVGTWYSLLYFTIDVIAEPMMAALYILVDNVLGMLIFIAYIAMAMTLCRVKVASTQFACYMAVANLGLSAGSAIYPTVTNLTGVRSASLFLAVLFFLSWVAMFFFNLDRHKQQLAKLD